MTLKTTSRQHLARVSRGQTVLTLSALMSLVVFPLIAILSFELSRVYLASQQLQNASDAAALTAVAQLASQDIKDPTRAHIEAVEAALTIFKGNAILGQPLNNVSIVPSKSDLDCSVGEAKLFVEFINPHTGQVVPYSSPDGKIVRVASGYGGKPAFGNFIKINNFKITAISEGAVPMLDIVICFDVSGSMDDQTPVTLVKRVWDNFGGKNSYSIVNGKNGKLEGRIYDILKPAPSGAALDALEPQELSDAWWQEVYFSEWLAKTYGVPGLRSGSVFPETGRAPGNCPPGTAPTFPGERVVTDVVVNIDGNTHFQGFTYNGYSFPDLATLVEASRGNLDDQTAFETSKAKLSLPPSITPRAGYQSAYHKAATEILQPIKDSKEAATLFNIILNTDTDCHFSFIAFDSTIGSSATSTETFHAIDGFTPYSSRKDFPLPLVELNPQTGQTNFNQVNTSIDTCVPLGGTNIGQALHKAVQILKNKSRKGSVRAIVLFTDGQPTEGGPLDNDEWMNARKAAVEAKEEGTAIYTIGLAQNPEIMVGQMAILNDTNPDPMTGGVAAIAGNGGTFNLVTDSKQLRVAFEKIARRLVQLLSYMAP